MKKTIIAFALLSLTAIGKTEPADPAKLILKPENRCVIGTFFLDASVELHWTQDLPLVIEGWTAGSSPMVIAADIELVDEQGDVVPKLLTTGPAPAFRTTATIKQGERRTFPITTICGFEITRSGTYSAAGTLRGATTDGKPIVVVLSKISFHVTTEARKPPN